MNCHFAVKKGGRPGSDLDIAKIVAAYESGRPLKWKKVHDLPDFSFFNHSVHINSGVSCVECHGRVDRMDGDRNRVATVSPLSMGWCIDCHRSPERHLRPRDQVFNLNWGRNLTESEVQELRALKDKLNIGKLDVNVGDELTDAQRATIGTAISQQTLGDYEFLRNIWQRTDCSLCHR